MALYAFILRLHQFEVSFLWGNKVAYLVMLIKAFDAFNGYLAGCWIVRAEEIEQDIGDTLDKKGRAAFIRAPVDLLPDI